MSLFQQNEMSSRVTVGHQKSQLVFYWVAQVVKNLPAMWETWVPSLGREDPLEKEMASHFSILAWKITWTEEPGGLQSIGSQRVGQDWATSLSLFYGTVWFYSPVTKWRLMCLMQSEAKQTKTSELGAGKVYWRAKQGDRWPKVYWKSTCPPSWTYLVLISLHVLGLCHSFKGCAYPLLSCFSITKENEGTKERTQHTEEDLQNKYTDLTAGLEGQRSEVGAGIGKVWQLELEPFQFSYLDSVHCYLGEKKRCMWTV